MEVNCFSILDSA